MFSPKNNCTPQRENQFMILNKLNEKLHPLFQKADSATNSVSILYSLNLTYPPYFCSFVYNNCAEHIDNWPSLKHKSNMKNEAQYETSDNALLYLLIYITDISYILLIFIQNVFKM